MQQPKYAVAAVASLLLLMFGLAGGAARHESVAIDEVAHIGAGVSYLQKLDMRMNEEHPPLAKMIAAIPLVIRGVHADYSHVSWTFSGKILRQYLGEWIFGHWLLMRWNDPYSTLLWARVPMLLITLLLGLLIYICASQLGGVSGGLLCLAVYVSTPTFLAFGPLVITDIAIALFWLLAVWHLPEMWRSPSRSRVVQYGLILAGAFLTKFSSGLLFFVFVTFALSLRWLVLPEQPTEKSERRAWRRRAWRNLGKATLWSAAFVYIFYFVFSWNQPTDTFDVIPHFPASPVLRRLLMPIWGYLRGLVGFALTAGSRPTYILGHGYPHGVWFYFPSLFILKSPLAFLLLLALAVIASLVLKRRLSRSSTQLPSTDPTQASVIPRDFQMQWRALWVSLLVFVAVCMVNRLDLSIRHFSIALVLLILLLAPLPRTVRKLQLTGWPAAQFLNCATIALAIACLTTAVLAYPHYFPFLNVLRGNRPGFLLVNDSNLDWSQAFPEVESFVQQKGLKQVLFDEYGFSEPYTYVPEAKIWSCQEATKADSGQWAIVSASSIADGHNCLWLLQYPHQALAGGGMYAFQLPPVIPDAGTPGGPPLPEAYRFLAGAPGIDPRPIFLNCIRDPEQLQPTVDHMQEMFKEAARKNKAGVSTGPK